MTEDRFLKPVVELVAKRAANTCSNPDCNALTSGPADDPSRSINVGEAAHIYGAAVGASRYVAEMSSSERADVTNAIWLCRNCHKLVDNDPLQFPAGLLFEWRRGHEQMISERIGKAGALARRRYEERHISELGQLSYRAEQIILERPEHWEYKLTSEILRIKLGPVLQRWADLKTGLYTKNVKVVPPAEVVNWLDLATHEAGVILGPFDLLVSDELSKAWGPLGKSGSEADIIRVCGLLADACQRILQWEEDVRFARFPDQFEAVQRLLVGLLGRQIDEIARVPRYLADMFSGDPVPGEYYLSLVFSMPEGWVENLQAALRDAITASRN
jgi:hypothetical protein